MQAKQMIIEAEGRGTQTADWRRWSIERETAATKRRPPKIRYLGVPELTDRRSHQARRRAKHKSLILASTIEPHVYA
jgi:hypothetical protein